MRPRLNCTLISVCYLYNVIKVTEASLFPKVLSPHVLHVHTSSLACIACNELFVILAQAIDWKCSRPLWKVVGR